MIDHIIATRTTTAWPLLLSLFSEEAAVPAVQRIIAVKAIGSFLMRRGICGMTTSDYNRTFVSVLGDLKAANPEEAGLAVERALAKLTSDSRRWPEDGEFLAAVFAGTNFYALPRSRQRAFFAGIENYLRGADYTEDTTPVEAVREQSNIEHVLLQRWQAQWPLPETDARAEN